MEMRSALEELFLFIDNSAPALARVMYHIRWVIKHGKDPAGPIRWYITQYAVSDMRIYGDNADRENSSHLRRILVKASEEEWKEVAAHYIRKHDEGNIMREYLSDELRVLEESW